MWPTLSGGIFNTILDRMLEIQKARPFPPKLIAEVIEAFLSQPMMEFDKATWKSKKICSQTIWMFLIRVAGKVLTAANQLRIKLPRRHLHARPSSVAASSIGPGVDSCTPPRHCWYRRCRCETTPAEFPWCRYRRPAADDKRGPRVGVN